MVRRPAAASAPIHPGTAVRWEDDLWEVIGAEDTPGGGARYELAPWDDQHAIRVLLPNDEKSEAERSADARDVDRRRSAGRLTLLLGPVAGLLPGRIQERLGGPAFEPLFPLLIYFLPESLLRLGVAMSQGRPIGSALGLPLYVLGRLTGLLGPSRPARLRARHVGKADGLASPRLSGLYGAGPARESPDAGRESRRHPPPLRDAPSRRRAGVAAREALAGRGRAERPRARGSTVRRAPPALIVSPK